jgi:hypothetical protein
MTALQSEGFLKSERTPSEPQRLRVRQAQFRQRARASGESSARRLIASSTPKVGSSASAASARFEVACLAISGC